MLVKKMLQFMPCKTKFVFISTDQLFDGRRSFAQESDLAEPVNVYGKTKLAAENLIKKSGRRYLILRTNFFGWSAGRKKTFGEWLVKSLRQRQPIHLFKDFYFTPMYVTFFARAVDALLKKEAEGLFHVAGRDRVSKYDFAKRLAQVGGLPFKEICKVKLDSDKKLAKRPKDISLNAELIHRRFGICPVRLQCSLKKFLADEKITGNPEKGKT